MAENISKNISQMTVNNIEYIDENAAEQNAKLVAYLRLLRTTGLGAHRIKQLVLHFSSVLAVNKATSEELSNVSGIGKKLIAAIMKTRQDAQVTAWISAECQKAQQQDVSLIHFEHPNYPPALKHIHDPPPILYIRGEIPSALLNPWENLRALAIVGTRKASPYALTIAKKFAYSLATQQICIVSGLALGVDGKAHEGALQASQRTAGKLKGTTVAVLGSALDVIYPPQHKALSEAIVASGGAIISEYPLGTEPNARNFPGRNRIINGLSAGILVVEAGKKSGALITAEYALAEGRTVFAVPGRIDEVQARGGLELIQQGASLVCGVEDILFEMGWQEQNIRKSQSSLLGISKTSSVKKESIATLEPAKPPVDLNADEKTFVDCLEQKGALLEDDLIVLTGKNIAEVMAILSQLEAKNLIVPTATGRYELTK